MKNFKKILVVALAVVLCLTALSVTTLADADFNPTVKISARFDETGEKLIAAVVTSQECGAIKGTLTFSDNLILDENEDSPSFVEKNDDTKYVVKENSVTFVILADDMEKGDTHWADFYFTVNTVKDVTFKLSNVQACDVNETLAEDGIKLEDATVTLTTKYLKALGAQFRENTPALRFGSRLERNAADNKLGDDKTAVRCGYIAGFEFKVGEGEELKATEFDTGTGKITEVTTGAINKQAQYYLSSKDDYIIYTYAVKGFDGRKVTTNSGDVSINDLPIVARPYVVYYDATEKTYGIEYGAQISKSFAEVQEISNLISGSGSYEK